jgi:predicted nucleic acid-binding protein
VTTLLDTNIISDLMYRDERWWQWSFDALVSAKGRGEVMLNAVVYAELCVRPEIERGLNDFLTQLSIDVAPISTDVARAAALAFREYRVQGGPKVNVLPDFFIGAHALVDGYALLTRDATRFKTYFPTVNVLAP